jgi:hypothetical protein
MANVLQQIKPGRWRGIVKSANQDFPFAFRASHLDFGGIVVPAQFFCTARNDIELCPYPQRRGSFSQASLSLCIQCSSRDLSAGFYRRSNDVPRRPLAPAHLSFSRPSDGEAPQRRLRLLAGDSETNRALYVISPSPSAVGL